MPLQFALSLILSASASAGEIHDAARNGDIIRVGQLLAQNPTLVSSTDTDKRQPLMWAASMGHPKIVKLLLTRGADVRASTPWDGSALHVASANGHSEVVKLLLANGADPNAMRGLGTPLHAAAYNGHESVAKILLDSGAARSVLDPHGRSAFHVAVNEEQFPFAKLLLRRGESVDIRDGSNRTPLENALLSGREAQTRFLLSHSADVNVDSGLATNFAIGSGNEQILRLFLEFGPNMNVKDKAGDTPLHWAIRAPQYIDSGPSDEDLRKQEEECNWVVPLLIKQAGIDVNAKNVAGETPLKLAKNRRFLRVVKVLKDHGAQE